MTLIIGALACVLGFVTTQPNPVNAQGRETVSGRVLSASDSLPLAGVRVRVMGATAQSESDSNGRFVLRGVPLGALRLLFERLGIVPDTLELAQPGRGIIVYLRPRAVAVRPLVATAASAARERFVNLAQTSTVSLDPIDVAAAPGLAEPDVIQTVQLLPGTVAQSDYSLGFSVRGGRRDQNLVLIDGITVFNPSHMGGLFSMFDPAAVREVDLITGGFPARYGGRLSSVLDVDLRDGNPNSTDVHGLVSLVASKLLVEGPVGRTGVSYMVGARGSYPDAAQRISGAGRIPFRFVDALAKITVPLGTGGSVSTTGYWGRDIGTIPWLTAEPGREGVDAEFTLGNRLVGVNFQQPLGAARLEQHLAVSEFSTRLAFVPDIRQFENSIRLLSASTSLAFAPPRHEVRLGVAVETYSMRYTIESEVLETQTLDEFYDPTVWSAFVEDQWRPVAWLLLRPGARIEYVTSAAFTGIAPRVAFKAFASENLAVVGSAGRYYQAVHSMKEEQAPVTEFDFWIGADEVTPVARSDQVVLGFEQWFGSGLSLTLEGYMKSFHNVLLRNVSDDPKLHGDEFVAADGSAHGLDLVLRRYSGPISGWVA